VPTDSADGLYPAEHRALRELFATSRQLSGHWTTLAKRLGCDATRPLLDGAAAAKELARGLEPMSERRGVRLRPAALGAGRWLAGVRNGSADVLLERNQALRLAVLDAEHVALLLGYLGALADRRGDEELAAFHRGWEGRLRDAAEAARDVALSCARDPDGAIEPAVPTAVGHAGHRVAAAAGALGEAIDSSPVGRLLARGGRGRS
jgi:hypothetical protein